MPLNSITNEIVTHVLFAAAVHNQPQSPKNLFIRQKGANNSLQVYTASKNSNNLRNELLIELKPDSLPLSTEFDIEKYADAVNIHLNEYPLHNRYVHPLCSDVILGQAKKPVTYTGIKGYFTINFWDKEKEIISLTLTNVLTVNGSGGKIILPVEHLDKIPIGWGM